MFTRVLLQGLFFVHLLQGLFQTFDLFFVLTGLFFVVPDLGLAFGTLDETLVTNEQEDDEEDEDGDEVFAPSTEPNVCPQRRKFH